MNRTQHTRTGFRKTTLLALSSLVFAGAAFAQDDEENIVNREVGLAASGWTQDNDEALPSPDGLLVDFKDDLDDEDIEEIATSLNIRFEKTSDVVAGNRYEMHGNAQALGRAMSVLEDHESIESVEPNVFYSLFKNPVATEGDVLPTKPSPIKPNDPQYKSQWHFNMVNAEGAWKITQGEGVVVAVIDTGVSAGTLENGKKSKFKRVPDLKQTEFVPGWNFVKKNNDPSDGNGHGTHVAGTIAQSTHNNYGVAGLAYKAKIMPIKVLSDRGMGSVGDIANGIRFAADKGAKVINMSLGGGMYSGTLAKAVSYAHKKGVTVVCAAGNGGRQKVEYPAKYPGCVAVSALGPDNKLAFYSSYGKELAIAAPGGDTRVDLNGDGIPDGVLQDTIARGNPAEHGFFPFQGTSMATPHVAAAAALVISAGVTDPDKVASILQDSAYAKNDAIRYGSGGLDAEAAVKLASRKKSGFALGFTMLFGVLAVRTRRKAGTKGLPLARMTGGALVGATGLFFLRDLGISNAFFTNSIIEWPSALLGFSSLSPLMASSLIAVAAVALLFGYKKLRPLLAGLAIGVAGFLVSTGLLGMHDISLIPGHGMLDAAWLLTNGAIAFVVGRAVIKK